MTSVGPLVVPAIHITLRRPNATPNGYPNLDKEILSLNTGQAPASLGQRDKGKASAHAATKMYSQESFERGNR